MRCPHCRGEIPPGSHFCGVCGQDVTRPPTASVKSGGFVGGSSHFREHSGASSVFELPVSQGARRARVGMLVALNLLLVGGGIALINGYLTKRDGAAQASRMVDDPKGEAGPPGADPKLGEEGQGGTEGRAPPPGADQAKLATREPGQPAATGDKSATDPPGSKLIEGAGDDVPAKDQPPKPDPRAPDPRTPDPDPRAPDPRAPDPRAPDPRAPDPSAPDPSAPDPSAPDPETPEPMPPQPGPSDAGAFATPPPSEAEEAQRVSTLSAKISLVISRHQGQLTRCYQSAAKITNPNSPLSGRIRLQFAVHPDGIARSIGVVSNDTGSAALGKCIVGLVGSWTFPSSGGDALDLIWPFEFQAP